MFGASYAAHGALPVVVNVEVSFVIAAYHCDATMEVLGTRILRSNLECALLIDVFVRRLFANARESFRERFSRGMLGLDDPSACLVDVSPLVSKLGRCEPPAKCFAPSNLIASGLPVLSINVNLQAGESPLPLALAGRIRWLKAPHGPSGK
jgi:hypothetical protein